MLDVTWRPQTKTMFPSNFFFLSVTQKDMKNVATSAPCEVLYEKIECITIGHHNMVVKI
jgi:hypothetical protein